MKIAFVDLATNKADAFEQAEAIAQETVSGLELVQFTSPDFLKVPASCARVLGEGVDAAIVFATLSASEWRDYGGLVVEKLMDVEINTGKFVFTAFIFEDEWRTEGKLAQMLGEKLRSALEKAAGMKHAPSEPVAPGLPEPPAAMGMFSLPTEGTQTEGSGSTSSGSGGNSLF